MDRAIQKAAICLAALAGLAPSIAAQEPEPQEEYVTLEEFDEAMEEMEAMKDLLSQAQSGSRNFLLSGFLTANYFDTADGPSAFGAGFNPVILWKVSDKLMVESELEMGAGGGGHGGSTIELGYAQVSYVANKWMTIGAGKFLSPFGQFNERFHPSWINRLPTAPFFASHEGIVPSSLIGAQIRGGGWAGSGQWRYALFVSNGPVGHEEEAEGVASEEGETEFLDFSGSSVQMQNKAVGGRVAYLPMPWMEIGVSGMSASVPGDEIADMTLLGVDLTATKVLDSGTLRVDGEFVQATLEHESKDEWEGGYGQVAYRPNLGESIISNFEGVIRYDWLGFPDGIPSEDEPKRWTAGLNYWLNATTTVKFAVEQLDLHDENDISFLLQLAIGL